MASKSPKLGPLSLKVTWETMVTGCGDAAVTGPMTVTSAKEAASSATIPRARRFGVLTVRSLTKAYSGTICMLSFICRSPQLLLRGPVPSESQGPCFEPVSGRPIWLGGAHA